VATFRYIEVRLMELTAAWTPTTAEMEVKMLFGKHIWDFAQHADALGKRTFELRMPEQTSLRPIEAYVALVDEVAGAIGAAARLAALYDGLLPGLIARYAAFLAETDALMDAPSVVIVERIVADLRRQCGEAAALRTRLSLFEVGPASDALATRERGIPRIVVS
jgi:hypothetical protein